MSKPDLHDNTRPAPSPPRAVGLNLGSPQKHRDIYPNGLRAPPQPPFLLLSKLSSERSWSQAWRVTFIQQIERVKPSRQQLSICISPFSHPGSQADGENALWLPLLYFIIIYTHLGHFPYLSSSLCQGGGWGGMLCHTDHGLPWQCPEIYLCGLYGNLTSELLFALVFFQEDLLGGCRHNYACMLASPGTFSTELARTRTGWPGINRGGHTSVLSLLNWMSHFFNELLYVLEKGFPVGNKNSAAFSQQM